MSKNISRGSTVAVALVVTIGVGIGSASAQAARVAEEIIKTVVPLAVNSLSGASEVEQANIAKLKAEAEKIEWEMKTIKLDVKTAELNRRGCIDNIVNKVDFNTHQQYNVIAINLSREPLLRSNSIAHYESAVCNNDTYGIWAFSKGTVTLKDDPHTDDFVFFGNAKSGDELDKRVAFSAPACSLGRAKGSIYSDYSPSAEAIECETQDLRAKTRPSIALGFSGAKHNSRTIAMIKSYARALVVRVSLR
jgi:hypothetical protein